MSKSKKTLEIVTDRVIPASPTEVFDAWLDPKTPGTPWHEKQKLILQPKVDGLFYWRIHNTPHYGLFTELKRGKRIRHTWMSQYTNGLESTVTVTFKKKGRDTVMTLTHSGLPNDEGGLGHKDGWNYFLDKLVKQWGKKARRRK